MKYFILILIIILLLVIISIYPFKITIYNQDNYLLIDVSKLITLRLNLFVLLDNSHIEDLKKQAKGTKVIKKVRFKEIDLKLQGLNFDYRLNGAYYGLVCAIAGFLNNVCASNDIKFNYDITYLGDKSIEFKTIIRARISAVIRGFYGI